MQDTNVISIFAAKHDEQWSTEDLATVEDILNHKGMLWFLQDASRRQCKIAAAIYRERARHVMMDYQHVYLRSAARLEDKAHDAKRPYLHHDEAPRPASG